MKPKIEKRKKRHNTLRKTQDNKRRKNRKLVSKTLDEAFSCGDVDYTRNDSLYKLFNNQSQD